MDAPESLDASGLDIELARRIDLVCRRVEQEWRDGRAHEIEAYLEEIPKAGRAALRTELEALARELGRSYETVARVAPDSAAEAPTLAPREPVTVNFGESGPRFEESATLAPTADATLAHSRTIEDQATIAIPSTSSSAGTSATPTRVRYFGDYEILREIARGGMGVVFQARQVSLNRVVALKMILSGQLAGEADVKRFYTEAEAAANLDHPGIVPIYEVGEHEGQHYFSMGFIEGQSLSQRLSEGPLSPREAAELMRRVSEAVEYAHQKGVIHRDLKPANVLLDQKGHPRVTDFGLAKQLASDSGLTGSGQIMGTPSYMPPEQAGAKRGDVGPAADVYALGATLYALLTGRPPFQAATPMDTVLQVISDEPVPPRRLNASIPIDIETICLKCLQKEPGNRYASAAALGEDLQRYLNGEPIVARPVTPLERAVKWTRRRPAIAGLLGLVALVAALGLGGVLWQWQAAVLARGVAERESRRAKDQTALAERESRRAKDQTALAEQRLQEALTAQAKEKEQTQMAEQRLYDVRMLLVQRYWDDYNGRLFKQELEQQLPSSQRGIDRRGFEWYYWQRRFSSRYIMAMKHPHGVMSVAFSPDGRRLASGGWDGTVRVWDALSGQEVHLLKGHTGRVESVAFSPDGLRLASAGWDRGVRLWDALTGQEVRALKGHTELVQSVAFSPDGLRLASASRDRTVKVWELATGREILTFKGHPSYVNCVVFSADGRRLASAGDDNTIRIWDAATGQEDRVLRSPTSMRSIALSRVGNDLAAGGRDGTVRLWNTATGQEIRTLKGHTHIVNSVAFSPDGERLASASHDGTVRLWGTDTGQEINALKGHSDMVNSVAFSPDGRTLASASLDGTAILWETAPSPETLTLKGHSSGVRSVAFSPDGRRIASASIDCTVKLWDAATGEEKLTLKGHRAGLLSVAFSPDGHRLASAGYDHTVKLWDVATGQELFTLKGHANEVKSVAFSPDGRRLASASWGGGGVKLWDTATGQETLAPRGHNFLVASLAFSPDGQQLATACQDGMVRVWDPSSGQEVRTLRAHSGFVYSVSYAPNSRSLLTAGYDGTARVWDFSTGREILTLKGHTGMLSSAVFSPNERRLASSANGLNQVGEVKIWDAATGLETLTLKGHTGSIHGVAFSPDSTRLATASDDGTVRVWDGRP